MKIYLGGMAKAAWMNKFIKLLDTEYCNPVIEMWNSNHKDNGEYEKVTSDYAVYLIDSVENAISTVAEVVYDSITRPSKTILCVEDHDIMDRSDIKYVISLIDRCGANFFPSLDEAVEFINYESSKRFKVSKEVDCILANMEQSYGFR